MQRWKWRHSCVLALWTAGALAYGQTIQIGREVAIPKHLQDGEELVVRSRTGHLGLLITREESAEQRAYFTETATATICDIEVTGGQLVILRTHVKVPAS